MSKAAKVIVTLSILALVIGAGCGEDVTSTTTLTLTSTQTPAPTPTAGEVEGNIARGQGCQAAQLDRNQRGCRTSLAACNVEIGKAIINRVRGCDGPLRPSL